MQMVLPPVIALCARAQAQSGPLSQSRQRLSPSEGQARPTESRAFRSMKSCNAGVFITVAIRFRASRRPRQIPQLTRLIEALGLWSAQSVPPGTLDLIKTAAASVIVGTVTMGQRVPAA